MESMIANIRIVEDTLAFILLSIALIYLLSTVVKLKSIPIRIIPVSLIWGLIPLYIWKTMGMMRRVFMQKADNPELYKWLHDIGEIFESFAGLIIALSFIYILIQLRKLVPE
jgi:hypothetical protein